MFKSSKRFETVIYKILVNIKNELEKLDNEISDINDIDWGDAIKYLVDNNMIYGAQYEPLFHENSDYYKFSISKFIRLTYKGLLFIDEFERNENLV